MSYIDLSQPIHIFIPFHSSLSLNKSLFFKILHSLVTAFNNLSCMLSTLFPLSTYELFATVLLAHEFPIAMVVSSIYQKSKIEMRPKVVSLMALPCPRLCSCGISKCDNNLTVNLKVPIQF